MYAVFRSGSKQYQARVGDQLTVEKLPFDQGEQITLDEVLLVADGETVKVGAPLVAGAHIKATVLAQEKGPKVRIFKYRPKERYRRRGGHRQTYTRLRVDEIVA